MRWCFCCSGVSMEMVEFLHVHVVHPFVKQKNTHFCLRLSMSASVCVCISVFACVVASVCNWITAFVTSHRCRCALTVCWVSLAGKSFLVLLLFCALMCTGMFFLDLRVCVFLHRGARWKDRSLYGTTKHLHIQWHHDTPIRIGR